MSHYADTSYLVSLYTPDANSVEASELFASATPLSLTPFGELEFVNALELRVFRKELAPVEVDAYLRAFQEDINAGLFVRRAIPAVAYERAMILAKAHTRELGARGMDILHVAIAIELAAGTFFTLDRVQRRLARAAGLTVRLVR